MIKAAIIGVGQQGKRILQALQMIPNLEIIGVVDKSKAMLKSIDKGIKTYDDINEFYKENSIDLLCIATNGPSHCELVLQASKKKVKFIFLEKPMACSIIECEKIIKVITDNDIRLLVNHLRRLHPIYKWLKEKIISKEMGQIRSLNFLSMGIGLSAKATHWFDLSIFLLEEQNELISVTAQIDEQKMTNPRGAEFIDPGGIVILEFTNHCRSTIEQIEDGFCPLKIEAIFTNGYVEINEKTGIVKIMSNDNGKIKIENSLMSAHVDIIEGTKDMVLNLLSTDDIVSTALSAKKTIEILISAYSSDKTDKKVDINAGLNKNLYLPIT